jgi:hypothetical protein
VGSGEAWGTDAITPLALIAARTKTIHLTAGIMQIGARTPAMVPMTAMGMQSTSGGRFILGLGASGPQVIEGWHGVPFDRPIRRTREHIEIVKMIARGKRLEYHGEIYDLPLPGGQGRAVRPAAEPVDIPIYLASLGPQNLIRERLRVYRDAGVDTLRVGRPRWLALRAPDEPGAPGRPREAGRRREAGGRDVRLQRLHGNKYRSLGGESCRTCSTRSETTSRTSP